MKKVFMGMFAIATMLLATSCSEDELIAQSSGNEVSASFKVSVRSDVKTKAVGDDTKGIDQLIFAVYDENKNLLEELTQTLDETKLIDATDGKKTATINVVLVKGQTYSFAFWAQNQHYAAYDFNPATATVTVDYDQLANQKEADAFFANEKLTVSGTFEKDITLQRPFAQVNFLTTATDLDNAKKAGFVPYKSSIVVKNAATSLNVLDGTVTGSTEAIFNLANLIENTETTTIKDAQGSGIKFEKDKEVTYFRYLATAYFLTTEGAAGTTIDASMNVVAEDNGKMDLSVPGVNAQRNFRTNIYGNLLTSGGKFNVTVDPGFDGDYSVEVEEETVTYDKLSDALTVNKDNTEALTYNVEAADEQNSVSIEIPAGTSAASLTFSLEDLADNATISVSNAAGGDYDNPVVIEVPEGVNLGALTVEVPNAHVTLKQGSYTTVVSTTSSTTLEVGAGTTIGTLTVNQGNVRIAEGGKVGTIVNETGGTLYIIDAGGTLPTTLLENTIVIYEDTKHNFVLSGIYSTDNISDLLGYAGSFGAGDYTITLNADIKGDVTVAQQDGVNVVIDGNGHKYDGSIRLDGKSRNDGTETLTITNIEFETSQTKLDFIWGDSRESADRYAHNVTVKDCKFTGPGTANNEVVALRYRQCYNMKVENCTATGLHSFAQVTSSVFTAENVTINAGSGFNFLSSGQINIENCIVTANTNISSEDFGVRMDGEKSSVLNITGSTLTAKDPIILRNTTATFKLALENSTLNKIGDYHIVIKSGVYPVITGVDDLLVCPTEVSVSTVEDMRKALSDGAYIKMSDRLLANPVNGACFEHNNKSIIDGQNFYIWNYDGSSSSIKTSGGIIKNVGFWQTQKAISIVAPTSKVILNNVEVYQGYNANYAIHCDSGNGHGLEATNCKFYAYISYAKSLGNVLFVNCTFGENKSGTKGLNIYADTEFVNCEFESDCKVNINEDSSCTFKDCKLKGVAITAENIATLVTGEIANATVK